MKAVRPPKASSTQSGFILVATLWLLAMITLAAGYFAERVSRAIALAQQKQDTAERLIEFANTRAEVLYRLGTVHLSRFGLGEGAATVALDDRAYRGNGADVVRLQDMRGLLNVNFIERPVLQNLFGQFGVPVERRDALLDTLLDYTDEDDLRRLNGAELAEYVAAGLPVPPNTWLISPQQLKNIIGWRGQATFWREPGLLHLVSASRVSGLNPNTAPLEVLTSLPGITRETAVAIIKLRNETPLMTTAALPGLISGAYDPESLIFFPSSSIRITQQGSNLPWARQFTVTLTPTSEIGPWRIDYTNRAQVSYPVENVEKIKKLPLVAPKSPNADDML